MSSIRPSSRLRRWQVILKAHKHSGSLLEALQVRVSAATPRLCSPPPVPASTSASSFLIRATGPLPSVLLESPAIATNRLEAFCTRPEVEFNLPKRT